jgi:hypothetical protein
MNGIERCACKYGACAVKSVGSSNAYMTSLLWDDDDDDDDDNDDDDDDGDGDR